MTLAEFHDLCVREWGEARGEVTGIALTDQSYEELSGETSKAVARLVNPVTGSLVKVTWGADEDKASVRRYYAEPHPAGA